MKAKLNIENKDITIYYQNLESAPVIVLNTFNENTDEIYNLTKNMNYILVTISNLDWDQELSPWHIEPIYKNDNFSGGSSIYLETLTNLIIKDIANYIKTNLNINITYYALGGYSLAGLFSIYSMYNTTIFKRIICVSGSLWYPGIIDYIENNQVNNIDKIYFSLGNKESNTKNEIMAKVEENTKYIKDYYLNQGIKTIYEENEGNHFSNPEERISKGILWTLKED